MGYTNYWYVKKTPRFIPLGYIKDLKKLCNAAESEGIKLCGSKEYKEGKPHIDREYVLINDATDLSDGFYLDTKEGYGFNSWTFCKTRRAPFDAFVKCALILGVQHGLFYKWDFDGDKSDDEYKDAIKLLKKAGFKVKSGATIDTESDDKYEEDLMNHYRLYSDDDSYNESYKVIKAKRILKENGYRIFKSNY